MIYTQFSCTSTMKNNLSDKSCTKLLKFPYGLLHSILVLQKYTYLKCHALSEMTFYSVWPDTFLFWMEREKIHFVHSLTAIKIWIAISKMGALKHCLPHGWRQRCWLGSKGSPQLCPQAWVFLYLLESHLSYAGECLQKAKREYA